MLVSITTLDTSGEKCLIYNLCIQDDRWLCKDNIWKRNVELTAYNYIYKTKREAIQLLKKYYKSVIFVKKDGYRNLYEVK